MPASNRPPTIYYSVTKEGKIKTKLNGTEQHFDNFTGRLSAIRLKTDQYEGNPIEKIEFEFTEGDTREVLSTSLTGSVGRSILNTLLGSDLGQCMLEIGTYLKEVNGKTYVNASVKINGQKGTWAIEPKDFPKPVEYQTPGGKKALDYTNVEEFARNLVRQASAKLNDHLDFNGVGIGATVAPAPAPRANPYPDPAPKPAASARPVDEDDDLPF